MTTSSKVWVEPVEVVMRISGLGLVADEEGRDSMRVTLVERWTVVLARAVAAMWERMDL